MRRKSSSVKMTRKTRSIHMNAFVHGLPSAIALTCPGLVSLSNIKSRKMRIIYTITTPIVTNSTFSVSKNFLVRARRRLIGPVGSA